MKLIIKYSALVLLTGVLFHFSCRKETSCESCNDKNKPPLANAGPDQVITLPTDSVSLDGSSSSDPDGKISEWLWTKISGPAFFTIIKPSDSTTKIKSLVTGIYQFELKVTDNGGLSAKDTVQITVNDPAQSNRPPVANAGADQIITLPTNAINLDGSSSTDPDNNITAYEWTKVSGPTSFNIVNSNAVQTKVTNLVQGSYQFALKVTDGVGLLSKDTMQVVVNSSLDTCGDNRPIINGQLTAVGTLSLTRRGISIASAGNKILFAGGETSSGAPSSVVDIYDLTTQSWSTAQLSIARHGLAAISAGNKVYFAGGQNIASNNYSARVDIYDAISNTWTTADLSEQRGWISVGTIGNKIMFAGGDNSCVSNGICTSDRIDIYDTLTKNWSSASLSMAREGMSVTTAANKIYFAGGHDWRIGTGVFDNIDIYDNSTNTWSTSTLNQRKAHHGSVVIGNYILWAGGDIWNNINDFETTCLVEKRDLSNGTSTILHLSSVSKDKAVTTIAKNGSIVFFSGHNKFDIYDVSTNIWSIGVLPINIDGASIISVNNIIYVAGAYLNGNISNASNSVWKLDF